MLMSSQHPPIRPRRITAEPQSLDPRSQKPGESTRRINITMLESHHDELVRRGLNVSGLIRELVDRYLSERTITLEVDAETRLLFEQALVGSGATSADIASRLRHAMSDILDERMKELETLRKELRKK
jgi:hypothetical protein